MPPGSDVVSPSAHIEPRGWTNRWTHRKRPSSVATIKANPPSRHPVRAIGGVSCARSSCTCKPRGTDRNIDRFQGSTPYTCLWYVSPMNRARRLAGSALRQVPEFKLVIEHLATAKSVGAFATKVQLGCRLVMVSTERPTTSPSAASRGLPPLSSRCSCTALTTMLPLPALFDTNS